jgi:hypothetical protein
MKYREALIPKNKSELRDRISDAMLRVPQRKFSDAYDFDGTFYSLLCGAGNVGASFTPADVAQLRDMLGQAKNHYEAGENKLAGALMEDTKMLVMGRQSWAYPKDLYRWNSNAQLPEITEADLLAKEI